MNTHVRDNLLETAPGKASAALQTVWSSAANAISMVPAALYVSSDYATTGSYATVTGMSWTTGASEVWAFNGVLYITITGSGVAIAQWSLPASAVVTYSVHGYSNVVNTVAYADQPHYRNTTDNNTAIQLNPSATNSMCEVVGYFVAGGTGGTTAFQGKLNSGTSATIKKGSHLHLTRLA